MQITFQGNGWGSNQGYTNAYSHDYTYVSSAMNTFYGTTMKATATNVNGADSSTWGTGVTYTVIPSFLDGAKSYIYSGNLPSGELICAFYNPDSIPNNVWPQSTNNLWKNGRATYLYYWWLYAGTGCDTRRTGLYYCDNTGCDRYPRDFNSRSGQGNSIVTPNAFWQERIQMSYRSTGQITFRAGNTQVSVY
jgi:hypothetical protein